MSIDFAIAHSILLESFELEAFGMLIIKSST
jgi:hypothetical protein